MVRVAGSVRGSVEDDGDPKVFVFCWSSDKRTEDDLEGR